MRIVCYSVDGRRGLGRLTANGAAVEPFELGDHGRRLGALPMVRRMAKGDSLPATGEAIALSDLTLEAPIPRPARNIFCAGKNYSEHVKEFARSGYDSGAGSGVLPDAPILFSKLPECVTGPGMPIRIDPGVSENVDYEAELAVVIGRGGRGIPRHQAMDHVWGFTIVNDVTARDLQARHKQWLLGKSQDTFCPMGPYLVSADELDSRDLRVRCWVNGELRQDSSTGQLIFDIPTLIATISAGITLIPGDIIATGTPAGVGVGFNPPKFLQDGDVVRIEIDGIGVLENPVQAVEGAA